MVAAILISAAHPCSDELMLIILLTIYECMEILTIPQASFPKTVVRTSSLRCSNEILSGVIVTAQRILFNSYS